MRNYANWVAALLPKRRYTPIDLDRATPTIGVGIALSPSYGTVAIRYADGSVRNVAQLQGDRNYIQAMKRLSDESARDRRRDHATLSWDDEPRLLWRKVRTRAGFPASYDVKVLGKMIKNLKREAESQLGISVEAAFLALPNMPALYEEDAKDAMRYVKLSPLGRAYQYSFNLREIDTTYVGYGSGLAEHYKHFSGENSRLMGEDVLFVQLTRECLLLDWDSMLSANRISTSGPITAYVNFTLGVKREDQPTYWNEVRDSIHNFIDRIVPSMPDFSKVLITGEGASQRLRDIIAEATTRFENVDIFLEEPIYTAARGAAELAWRSLVVMHAMSNDDPYRFTTSEEAQALITSQSDLRQALQ